MPASSVRLRSASNAGATSTSSHAREKNALALECAVPPDIIAHMLTPFLLSTMLLAPVQVPQVANEQVHVSANDGGGFAHAFDRVETLQDGDAQILAYDAAGTVVGSLAVWQDTRGRVHVSADYGDGSATIMAYYTCADVVDSKYMPKCI